jgi:hypothetical protein
LGSAGSKGTGSGGCPRCAGCSLISKRPQGRLVHTALLPPKALLPPHALPFRNGEFHLATGQQFLPGLRLLLALPCRELSHLGGQPSSMAAGRLKSLAPQPHMDSVKPFLIKSGCGCPQIASGGPGGLNSGPQVADFPAGRVEFRPTQLGKHGQSVRPPHAGRSGWARIGMDPAAVSARARSSNERPGRHGSSTSWRSSASSAGRQRIASSSSGSPPR